MKEERKGGRVVSLPHTHTPSTTRHHRLGLCIDYTCQNGTSAGRFRRADPPRVSDHALRHDP